MKEINIYCDRCKRLIEGGRYVHFNHVIAGDTYDLCYSCIDDIRKWEGLFNSIYWQWNDNGNYYTDEANNSGGVWMQGLEMLRNGVYM